MSRSNRDHWPDDETLVAFADGALAPDEAEKVAAFVAENEDARRFVERLRSSGDLAKEAFDRAMHDAQSDARLAALILDTKSPETEANVVSLPPRQIRTPTPSGLALPMAAAIALIVGGIGGYEFGRRASEPVWMAGTEVAVGPVKAGTPLATLLDEKPSGEAITLSAAPAQDLMVVASFRDANGRICREFEAFSPDTAGPVTAGIACRNERGVWRVEGAAQLAEGAEPPSQDYSPASGGDAAAMEGLLKALGAKPALSKNDEEALLKNKWR